MRSMLWQLLLAFVLASSATAYLTYRTQNSAQTQQHQQTLQAFAQALSKPLWDCDTDTIHAILTTIALQPDVHSARLHDRCTGQDFAAGAQPLDASTEAGAATHALGRTISYTDPRQRNHPIGTLHVHFQRHHWLSAAAESLWAQVVVFAAMVAALLAGAALVFRRTIGQPLAQFRSAILAQRVLRDGTESPARHADELWDVTHAYDAMVQELQQLARRDALTGLPNRMALLEHLHQAIEIAQRQPERSLHVLMLDLDGFKPINDRDGHEAGDQVLRGVAQRLQEAMRHSDFVARLGGDEFVVVAQSRGTEGSAALPPLLERITAAVQTPLQHHNRRLQVGASIGVAHYPEDGSDPAQLLAQADAAMYEVKKHRKAARR